MLDFRNALEVIHSDNGTFKDYKKEALDFSRDNFSVTLTKDEDYLYFGFYKPINSIYVDMTTPNTASGTASFEFWNGTAFTTLEEIYDETDSFRRNGFVAWRRNQTLEVKTTLNSTEAFWYRIKLSATSSAISFRAINILFSDDQALKLKFNKILETEFLDGLTSHNLVHAGVRDDIVEVFRRRGYSKADRKNSDKANDLSNNEANVTAWDLLDIYEVREAATYLALSRIFFDFSDTPDDIWMKKSLKYEDMYKSAMNTATLSMDEDDNGEIDKSENMASSKTTYISR